MEGSGNGYENFTRPVNINKPSGKILLNQYAEKCRLKILPGLQEIIDIYAENEGKTLNINQKKQYEDFLAGVENECNTIKEYMSKGKSKNPVDVAYIQYAESVLERWHEDYKKLNKNNASTVGKNNNRASVGSVESGVSVYNKAPRRARKGRKTRKSRKSRRNTRKN